MEYINGTYEEMFNGIRYGLLRRTCGTPFRVGIWYVIRLLGGMLLNNTDEMYLLNSYRCESHRWVIERYLENTNKSR